MEEIIQSITEAEIRAEEIKSAAMQKAAALAAEAQARAGEIKKASELDCKQFREQQLREAEERGEKQYRAALAESKAKATAYADSLMGKAERQAFAVAGRITDGGR